MIVCGGRRPRVDRAGVGQDPPYQALSGKGERMTQELILVRHAQTLGQGEADDLTAAGHWPQEPLCRS